MKPCGLIRQVLLSAGIILTLSISLAPIIKPPASAFEIDMLNLQRVGEAISLYVTDNDGHLPVDRGFNPNGPGDAAISYVPAYWPVAPDSADRAARSRNFVFNAVEKYIAVPAWRTSSVLASPPAGLTVEFQANRSRERNYRKVLTSYAYNGLLSSYPESAVVNRARLPLITETNGRDGWLGGGRSNPTLLCPNAGLCTYLPYSSTCWNGTTNGQRGVFFLTLASQANITFNHGQNWVHADGHVEFRLLGQTLYPMNSDYRVDPFNQYDSTGRASTFWWDGCHPWLFRPDYDFTR